jgi:hypothetical protein
MSNYLLFKQEREAQFAVHIDEVTLIVVFVINNYDNRNAGFLRSLQLMYLGRDSVKTTPKERNCLTTHEL